jgi:hypothetical protein
MPENNPFILAHNFGGINSLKRRADVFDTEYIWPEETLGNAIIRYRFPGEDTWREVSAFSSGDIRTVEESPDSLSFIYSGKSQGVKGIRDFTLAVRFENRDGSLLWLVSLYNTNGQEIEIGDLALPLPFNNKFIHDNLTNFTQTVSRHSFISGHASFIFWMRQNGIGPFLVMTPAGGSKLEYYQRHDYSTREISAPYWVFIHSAANGAGEQRGTWRQPHTSARLAPQGKPGDALKYAFKLQWAVDYNQVRQILFEEGLFDVQVVPGMTVPEDLEVKFSLRTHNRQHQVRPEFPEQTRVEYLGEKEENTFLYRVKFTRLGENALTVTYGDGRYLLLEFFVTQPLETLIKKRAAFLVDRQQHRIPEKWYDGLFSIWDMKNRVLRGPENTDGFDYWYGYIVACDDTALPKAPYIAAKNLHFPDKKEIEALEYYLKNFVWGKLQRTDQEEPYPYGIYGVPNWFENRYSEHGFDSQGMGLEHVWRSYDYPHLIMLYYHLYQIARQFPRLVGYLDAPGYLKRAWGTAKAYFDTQTLPQMVGYPALPFQNKPRTTLYWAYKIGIYNELLIVDLIESLEQEGLAEEAGWLRNEWEKKVKFFIYDDPYPFDSEFPFDTTAYESTHAVAKYALDNRLEPDENLWYDENRAKWYSHPSIKKEDAQAFMEKQIQANLAVRGWLEPAYYLLGSDYRGGESVRYQLSYMSQLGGWAILDYALNYASDPFPYLRLGYASYLSSWALMNTGTPETNYGFWYPGPENDGASGWAFLPEKYGQMWIRKGTGRGAWFYDGEIDLGYCGALRMAAAVIADDPIFGLVAYGAELTANSETIEIVPRDGLRKRVCYVDRAVRLQMALDWDGFAGEQPLRLSKDLHTLHFTLENRTGDTHVTTLSLQGFPMGKYEVSWNQTILPLVFGKQVDVHIPVSGERLLQVSLRRMD